MDHRLVEGLMVAIAPIIKESLADGIEKATAPLKVMVGELEARLISLDSVVKREIRIAPERGEKGDAGEKGPQGEKGEAGSPGEKGEKGDTGLPGEPGIPGIPGEKGIDGIDGVAGQDGLHGKDGAPGERGEKGDPGIPGERGLDGKDGAPGMNGKDGAPGERGEKGEPGLHGKDGAPGERGSDGVNGERGEKGDVGERGEVGLDGKDGADGRDGRDIDPDVIETMVLNAVNLAAARGIPKSFLINESGNLVSTYPNGDVIAIGKVRGNDGARGASVMDGSLDEEGSLVLRMSDGRHVNVGRVRGEKGKDGSDGVGRPGRDANEIQILPSIDESKSYIEGTCARWRGGVIRADRQTDAVIDGQIKAAGWGVILNGIASETETDLDDGRVVERETVYTDGQVFRRSFKRTSLIYRGVWKEGSYECGDGVTWNGSFFIAQQDTTGKPEVSRDWRLAVKRGQNSKDGRDIRPGGPVRISP